MTVDVLPSVNLVYDGGKEHEHACCLDQDIGQTDVQRTLPHLRASTSSCQILELETRILKGLELPLMICAGSGLDNRVRSSPYPFSHKRMEDAIEQVIVGGTNGQLQYQNVDLATIYGLEAEFRTSLPFMPGPGLFSTGLNASFVLSKVSIADSELEVRSAIDENASSTRELQGQSPYILNADVAWSSPAAATIASLYFNVFRKQAGECITWRNTGRIRAAKPSDGFFSFPSPTATLERKRDC